MPIIFEQAQPISPEVSFSQGATEQNNIDLPRWLQQQQQTIDNYMRQRQADQQDRHFYDQMGNENAQQAQRQQWQEGRDQFAADQQIRAQDNQAANQQKNMEAEYTYKDKIHRQQLETQLSDWEANRDNVDDETYNDIRQQLIAGISPLRQKAEAEERKQKVKTLKAQEDEYNRRYNYSKMSVEEAKKQAVHIEIPGTGSVLTLLPDPKFEGGYTHVVTAAPKEAKVENPKFETLLEHAMKMEMHLDEDHAKRLEKANNKYLDYIGANTASGVNASKRDGPEGQRLANEVYRIANERPYDQKEQRINATFEKLVKKSAAFAKTGGDAAATPTPVGPDSIGTWKPLPPEPKMWSPAAREDMHQFDVSEAKYPAIAEDIKLVRDIYRRSGGPENMTPQQRAEYQAMLVEMLRKAGVKPSGKIDPPKVSYTRSEFMALPKAERDELIRQRTGIRVGD